MQTFLSISTAFVVGLIMGRWRSMAVRSFVNQKAATWVCSIVENGRAIYGKGPTAAHAIWDLRQRIPKPAKKKVFKSKPVPSSRVQF